MATCVFLGVCMGGGVVWGVVGVDVRTDGRTDRHGCGVVWWGLWLPAPRQTHYLQQGRHGRTDRETERHGCGVVPRQTPYLQQGRLLSDKAEDDHDHAPMTREDGGGGEGEQRGDASFLEEARGEGRAAREAVVLWGVGVDDGLWTGEWMGEGGKSKRERKRERDREG